jgi:hypothetical protein
MIFIDQFQYTLSSAYSSMTESTTLSSTDYKAEYLVEIQYKLHDRTEAKCIRTQDKSYTTLHRRHEINALETHFIERYNFREGLASENSAFL